MENRVKQDLINTIKMLPQNDESFKLLKEMCIEYIINRDLRDTTPKQDSKPKLTGIEKRFQEDMINEMDSQY